MSGKLCSWPEHKIIFYLLLYKATQNLPSMTSLISVACTYKNRILGSHRHQTSHVSRVLQFSELWPACNAGENYSSVKFTKQYFKIGIPSFSIHANTLLAHHKNEYLGLSSSNEEYFHPIYCFMKVKDQFYKFCHISLRP